MSTAELMVLEHLLFPITITCQRCGTDIELWSQQERTTCLLCGFTPFEHESIVH